MTIGYLYWFVPACLAVSMAPGPSNVLSLSHASRQGFAAAWIAGCGRLLAFAAMTVLVAAGLAAVLLSSPLLFKLTQVIGLALLAYLALRWWRARKTHGACATAPDAGLLRMARNEFVLAAGNPKAIVVLTVLAPRAVDPASTAPTQLATLAVAFILVEGLVVAVYAAVGTQATNLLQSRAGRALFGRFGLRASR